MPDFRCFLFQNSKGGNFVAKNPGSPIAMFYEKSNIYYGNSVRISGYLKSVRTGMDILPDNVTFF
jgi:hypothetical protein